MTMTNAQLIAHLQTLPPNAEVLFDLGDEYIGVESVDCSDPTGLEDEVVAIFLAAGADCYREEEVNGVFQRFIGV